MDILHRYTKAVLFSLADAESIKDLVKAAVKQRADLSGAYLRSADLRSADLSGADLSGADLSGADLSGADLRSARGVNKYYTTSLYVLHDQVGPIRAYKLVNADLQSPIQGYDKLTYSLDSVIVVENADIDETAQCSRGINLATLDWCLREWEPGWRIMIAEFTAEDIAAIPIGSDGKFRVRKCKIVGEKPMSEWGEGPWTKKDEEKDGDES
jgi:hypothetical protein